MGCPDRAGQAVVGRDVRVHRAAARDRFGVLLTVVVLRHFDLGATGIFGIGVGILAYTLGMRQAFDADHIAAVLDYAGYGIVLLFLVAWLVALAVWRFGRIEERWSSGLRADGSGSALAGD